MLKKYRVVFKKPKDAAKFDSSKYWIIQKRKLLFWWGEEFGMFHHKKDAVNHFKKNFMEDFIQT